MRKKKYSKSTTIAFDQDVFDMIKDITDDEEISIAEFIRHSVDEYLEKYYATEV